ncbi:MAG: hypothetical protein KDK91_10745, partial [Gammaproteobacteria bacterium]|nr:hypothetical protein [Gammaproteobacteria bacterium]
MSSAANPGHDRTRVDGGQPDESVIRATYTLRTTPDTAARLARGIAYEQTVELPEAIVTDRYVNEHVVGRVEDVTTLGPERCTATIAYSADLASGQLSQLLNLVFGNVSMYPGVQLSALRLPETLLEALGGPR